MIDDKKDTVELDISEMSDEQKSVAWTDWVRNEVDALLDIYLPISSEGDVNIQYHHAVKEVYEAGPEYYDNKVDAVKVTLVFKFDELVDLSKPRLEDEE